MSYIYNCIFIVIFGATIKLYSIAHLNTSNDSMYVYMVSRIYIRTQAGVFDSSEKAS